RVRRGEDVLRRAVVLLKQDDRRVRVVLLELDDVPDRRAAERVDGLVGVTDDAQLGRRDRVGRVGRVGRGGSVPCPAEEAAAAGDQLADEGVLGVVRVL